MEEASDSPGSRRLGARLGPVCLAGAVVAGGAWLAAVFAAHERAALVEGWRARLSAMADDRQRAIEGWLRERDGDLRVLASFPTTRALVAAEVKPGHSLAAAQSPEAHLSELLGYVGRAYGYRGVWVVRGETVLARSPGARELTVSDLEVARRVAAGRDPLGGLTTAPGGPALIVAAWVDGTPGPRRAGLVVVEVDPARFLYAVLAPPPFASRTAESLLAAREGHDLVFLGPLRHASARPLELRRPFEGPALAARHALVAGTDFGEFTDYRGVRVLAATRRIQSRPWGLVVKVDRDEALAPFRTEMRLFATALAFALVAIAAIVASVRRAERFRARMQAVQDRARFATLLDQAEDVILFVDPAGPLLEANRRAEQVYGYTRDELRRMRAHELRPPEDRDEVTGRLAQTVEQGAARFEAVHQRKDGTRFPVEVNARLVDAGGDRIIVAIVRDMTESKAQQAALSESRAKLVAAEQQLLQAQKLEAVGRLAAGVAHDFNNLLTVVAGYARLVADSLAPDDPRRQDMAEILSAADRATQLTRQLLAFGRRQVLQPRVLNLNTVVAGVVQMLERVIGEDVRLVLRTDPELGAVEVDEGQIQQVLMNLAVNARDAMPDGGTLTIETANVVLTEETALEHVPARPGAYVMLAVSDSGIGMDADTRARAFEPFFTTKPEGKGTGLGLSMVYGIVKQSGGYIGVESGPGRGATFRMYFPRVDRPVALSPPPPAPAASAGARGETVLVVEDQPAVREFARRVLEDRGYQVRLAADGREALGLIEREGASIDLLITDLVMPEMGGLDLWHRARAVRPGLRVLFTSGYSSDAGQVRRLPDGACFLPKPFGPTALLDGVERALGRAEPPRAERPRE